MSERIAHDNPTVETLEGTLERYGRTNRPEIRVREPLADPGTVVRLVLDGSEYRSQVQTTTGGGSAIRGAFPTPRQAREPASGEDVLADWVTARDLDWGRTVHVDVVDAGFRYGIRAPGETATYPTGRPDAGLADIAGSLEDT
jgi:hypothetical protein